MNIYVLIFYGGALAVMRDENLENGIGYENENEGDIVYTFVDEDDVESDFILIKRIDIDGQSYVALAPVDDGDEIDEDEEGGFVVLKVVEEDGEEIFVTIDDDEEFDRIADIFEDELFQDMDYDGDEEDDEESEE